MKIAVVSNLDTKMMGVIERIREQSMSLNLGMDVAPVNRIIDIPMAVRRMGERPDVDSILVAVDFPELSFDHDRPLVESIRTELGLISREIGKPVSTELMDAKVGDVAAEKIGDILEGIVKKETGNSF